MKMFKRFGHFCPQMIFIKVGGGMVGGGWLGVVKVWCKTYLVECSHGFLFRIL